MPAQHLNCPICDVKVSFTNYQKHFFSRQHLEQHVKPALLKLQKNDLNALRNSTTRSSLPTLYSKGGRAVMCCFGCKSARAFHPQYHLYTECKHAEEHLTTLKELLGPVTEGEPTETGDVVALQRQLTATEKRLKETARLLSSLEEDHSDMEAFFTKMTGKDFDTFKTQMQEKDMDDPKEYLLTILDVVGCSSSSNSKKGLEENEPRVLSENPIETTSNYIPVEPVAPAPVIRHEIPVKMPPADSIASAPPPAPAAPRPKIMPKMVDRRAPTVIEAPPAPVIPPVQYDSYGNPMPRIISATKRLPKQVPRREPVYIAPVAAPAIRSFEELRAVDMNTLTEEEQEQWYEEMGAYMAAGHRH